MTKSIDMLQSAKTLSASAGTWADLSNALFDPVDGILARAFSTREERAAFVRSEEYKQIRTLVQDAVARTGAVEGAALKKSGRFIVRLPQSLHAALSMKPKQKG